MSAILRRVNPALSETFLTCPCDTHREGPRWLHNAVYLIYDARLAPLLLDIILVVIALTLVLSGRSRRLQTALPA